MSEIVKVTTSLFQYQFRGGLGDNDERRGHLEIIPVKLGIFQSHESGRKYNSWALSFIIFHIVNMILTNPEYEFLNFGEFVWFNGTMHKID